jgi:magnesium transporter
VTRGETALAVVDEHGRFLGMIPPQQLLAILLHEHDEDVARLGGFLRSSSQARHALEEPVWRRFAHRVPWLLLGLAGMAVSARIVGAFESALRRDVVVAFFVPGVVYLADAVGTQTETLFVRGLSVGVPMRRVVWRELVTGVLMGLAIAAAFLPLAFWGWQRADVAWPCPSPFWSPARRHHASPCCSQRSSLVSDGIRHWAAARSPQSSRIWC